MSTLIYRQIFRDTYSLRELAAGKIPKISNIRRRVFVTERRSDYERPDHFYKNYLNARLGDVKELHDLPWVMLSALAERFIERVCGALCIKPNVFGEWHELLPFISPLSVVVTYLINEDSNLKYGQDPRDWLLRELGSSALLSPFQPELQAMIDRDGLNEMHMHLNGSTEVDSIWTDAVSKPELYYKILKEEQHSNHQSLSEFYDQIEFGLTPYDFYRWLSDARRLRHFIADKLRMLRHDAEVAPFHQDILNVISKRDQYNGWSRAHHPIETIYPNRKKYSMLINEAAFLYEWMSAFRRKHHFSRPLGNALYHNLLVHGHLVRITVQQIDEYGFDQFQKYTHVGARNQLEETYEERFRQLNAKPPYNTLRHLEGRFAPKADPKKLVGLLKDIVQGYLAYRKCPHTSGAKDLRGPVPACLTGQCAGQCTRQRDTAIGEVNTAIGRVDAEFSLVAHFIKKPEKPKHYLTKYALHASLRRELAIQAQILRQAMERRPFIHKIIRGIDAAANELHAGPEVFVPVFRYMRRSHKLQATYHVGEDFEHLVSGIRATQEALTFLPLGMGDRMGHATALGISAKLWRERTGKKLLVKQGDYLDDLVYAYSHLGNVRGSADLIHGFESAIVRHCVAIYGQDYSPALLAAAWQMRALDILEVRELERTYGLRPGDPKIAKIAATEAKRVFSKDRRDEIGRIEKAVKKVPQAFEIYRLRHERGDRLNILTEIDSDWLADEGITHLQELMLKKLMQAGVTIETLPTSNVRISFYEHLREHHLFRWLGLTDDRFKILPDVCVGSDDTGIFATSLRNEYAAILEVLRQDFGKSSTEAAAILERLNQAGFTHRFRPIIE